MLLTALQSTSGTGLNVTSQQAIGTYAASAGRRLCAAVTLSNLNGAAATITLKLRNTTDGATADRYSVAKDVATDTKVGPLLLTTIATEAKNYAVQVTSANASDTNVSWAVDWYDLSSVEAASVTDKTGYTLTAAYDAAKTAAAPGARMDLVDAPNTTAITAIQAGLATADGLTALQSHGDAAWATADVSGLLTPVAFTAALPSNFSALLINASGHVSRVTVVDTNTDMRGTDNAMLAVSYTAAPTADQNATTLLAKTNGAATVAAQLAHLDADVSSVGGSGSGPRTVTITVNDGTDVLENAAIRLTNGADSYTADTNASGVATFNVAEATWTVAISKSGYTFAGASLPVSADTSHTYSMTQTVITPAADPTLCNCYINTYDTHGASANGVIEFRLKDGDATAGRSFPRGISSVAAVNGLLQTNLPRGFDAQARRVTTNNTGPWVDLTVPDAATYELPEILGQFIDVSDS